MYLYRLSVSDAIVILTAEKTVRKITSIILVCIFVVSPVKIIHYISV